MDAIGIIAGGGRLPFVGAAEAHAQGRRVVAVGVRGETDPALAEAVDVLHWVRLGQLGAVVKTFRREGVSEALLLGMVDIRHLFSNIRPDLLGARVLFKARADDPDPPQLAVLFRLGDVQMPVAAQRHVILADLVSFRQVGIVVVLPIPLGEPGDLAVQPQGRLHGKEVGLAIHHRKRSRRAGADHAGLGVRRRTERGATAAEKLAGGQQLDMDLQANDDLVGLVHGH